MTVKGIDYIKSAERWQEYGKSYHKDGSIYYAEGNKTALTITAFLIGFIGVFLQVGNVLNGSLLGRILISISLISALTSAITGLLLFRKMNEFLNKAGDYYEKLSENLFLWMFKNKSEYGDEYPKEIYKGIKLEPELRNVLSDIQLGSIIIAFITITIYFLSILFAKDIINLYSNSYKNQVNIKNESNTKITQEIIKSNPQKKISIKKSTSLITNLSPVASNEVFQNTIRIIGRIISIVFSGFVGAMIALWLDKINRPHLDILAIEDANIEQIYGSEKLVPGRCKFFRLKVINKPLNNNFLSIFFSRETAQQLNAFITFKELNKTMKGRWSDTLELAYTDTYSKIKLANFPDTVSIYAGKDTILDVFAKFESYNQAYGWNNEAYLDHNAWKTDKYKLSPGDYKIEVVVAGTNATIKKTFSIHIDKTIEQTSLT